MSEGTAIELRKINMTSPGVMDGNIQVLYGLAMPRGYEFCKDVGYPNNIIQSIF